MQLEAVADFDPHGDNREEHPELVASATDGNRETSWSTETYNSFEKDGVGLVLDAGSPVELSRLTVVTDTPGFTAMILAGSRVGGRSRTCPSRRRSRAARRSRSTRADEALRYYVVWITALDGTAHINEVRGFRST